MWYSDKKTILWNPVFYWALFSFYSNWSETCWCKSALVVWMRLAPNRQLATALINDLFNGRIHASPGCNVFKGQIRLSLSDTFSFRFHSPIPELSLLCNNDIASLSQVLHLNAVKCYCRIMLSTCQLNLSLPCIMFISMIPCRYQNEQHKATDSSELPKDYCHSILW